MGWGVGGGTILVARPLADSNHLTFTSVYFRQCPGKLPELSEKIVREGVFGFHIWDAEC